MNNQVRTNLQKHFSFHSKTIKGLKNDTKNVIKFLFCGNRYDFTEKTNDNYSQVNNLVIIK